MRKKLTMLLVLIMGVALMAPCGFAQVDKVGYVDLRRAFYDYEKTQNLEKELNTLTQQSQEKRTGMVEEITALRDEMEALEGEAMEKKKAELEQKLGELQEFDRVTRQKLLNRKNDMFRQVVEDIQKIVNDIGEAGKFDFILDSRNVMYGDEKYDLTDKVLKRLNK
jgi:Skp family chaperone for outer membrane proteins